MNNDLLILFLSSYHSKPIQLIDVKILPINLMNIVVELSTTRKKFHGTVSSIGTFL